MRTNQFFDKEVNVILWNNLSFYTYDRQIDGSENYVTNSFLVYNIKLWLLWEIEFYLLMHLLDAKMYLEICLLMHKAQIKSIAKQKVIKWIYYQTEIEDWYESTALYT